MKNLHLVLTCEHATNHIPSLYQTYFVSHETLLESHQGYDIGAVEIAESMAARLNAPLFLAKVSRLLIEHNRSLHHPDCFSSITQDLPLTEKNALIEQYYLPYRNSILTHFEQHISAGSTILHFSIHSFTPVWHGMRRQGDLCLLYDPARTPELEFAKAWSQWLKKQAPDLKIRRNYPYVGKTDGLASACRKQFNESQYIGFEIESNQAKVKEAVNQKRFAQLLAEMLITSLNTLSTEK